MSRDIVLCAAAAAFLAAWTWFWTGPELQWERELYTKMERTK